MSHQSSRTRERLLGAAREVVADVGARGLTFSAVAARAGASRQTVYQLWGSRELLLTKVLLPASGINSAPATPPRDAGGFDAHRLITGYLCNMRDALAAPGAAEAFTQMGSAALLDAKIATAVASIPASRRAALNRLLEPTGLNISQEDHAMLSGPVLYQMFCYRTAASNEFIARIISCWLLTADREPPQPVAA